MGDRDDCSILEDATSEHSLEKRVGFNVNRGLGFHSNNVSALRPHVKILEATKKIPGMLEDGQIQDLECWTNRGFVENKDVTWCQKRTRQ